MNDECGVYVNSQRLGEAVRCADSRWTAVLQRPEACQGRQCLSHSLLVD